MAAMGRFREMAETFMNVVRSETGFHVLIYDEDGCITMATDTSRVGKMHPRAQNMIRQGEKECIVTAEDARKDPLVREGYNRIIKYGEEPIGGFGITGPLAVTRPLGRMAVKMMASWQDEISLYDELERRVKERTLILKQEIEARRQAEQVLKESQARFEAFVKATPDILFVFDPDGRYVEIFTSSEDLLVDELSLLKGQLVKDVLPADVAEFHHRVIRETSETGRGHHFEYELDVPKGKCWFESRTAPIDGIDHGKRLVASSVRDITRRKLVEKEISEKAKLSVVIETAGAVCHEFNQPLQIITGSCELLETFSELDPEVGAVIKKISREAERMGKLNKNLMNITSYKTKTYLESKIIDLHQSIEKKE